MGYVSDVCNRYSELDCFYRFLEHQVLPIYQAKL